MSQTRSLGAYTLFRISFGTVWLIDGAMKFFWLQPSDVVDLIQGAGQDQPAWLQDWYSFWSNTVAASPGFFLYFVGLLELALGIALVFGFLRKPAYAGGVLLSLFIWAVDEGFGGPYGPGSTDIGAAIMYAFIFILLVIFEMSGDYNKYTLDAWFERSWSGWKRLTEL